MSILQLKNLLLFLIAAPAITLLHGCAMVDVEQETLYEFRDKTASTDKVELIQPGRTGRGWLLQNLGEPRQVWLNRAGEEYLYYPVQLRQQTVKRIAWFSSRETLHSSKHLYIHLRQARVQSYWYTDVAPDASTSETAGSKPIGVSGAEAPFWSTPLEPDQGSAEHY